MVIKTMSNYVTDKIPLHSIVMVVVLIFLFPVTSCSGNDAPPDTIPPPVQVFNAKVIGSGECGSAYTIKFNDNAENVPTNFYDNVFYETNLPAEYKINDLDIYVVFREITDDELYACTLQGLAYPQIYITSVIECYVGQDCD